MNIYSSRFFVCFLFLFLIFILFITPKGAENFKSKVLGKNNLVNFLNSKGIKILTFIDNQIVSENILGFNTIDFVGKEDVFLVLCLNTLFFTGIIFNKFFPLIFIIFSIV